MRPAQKGVFRSPEASEVRSAYQQRLLAVDAKPVCLAKLQTNIRVSRGEIADAEVPLGMWSPWTTPGLPKRTFPVRDGKCMGQESVGVAQ